MRKIDRAKVKELWQKGLTDEQIAKQLKCHKESIRRVRYELGLVKFSRKKEEEKSEIDKFQKFLDKFQKFLNSRFTIELTGRELYLINIWAKHCYKWTPVCALHSVNTEITEICYELRKKLRDLLDKLIEI